MINMPDRTFDRLNVCTISGGKVSFVGNTSCRESMLHYVSIAIQEMRGKIKGDVIILLRNSVPALDAGFIRNFNSIFSGGFVVSIEEVKDGFGTAASMAVIRLDRSYIIRDFSTRAQLSLLSLFLENQKIVTLLSNKTPGYSKNLVNLIMDVGTHDKFSWTAFYTYSFIIGRACKMFDINGPASEIRTGYEIETALAFIKSLEGKYKERIIELFKTDSSMKANAVIKALGG